MKQNYTKRFTLLLVVLFSVLCTQGAFAQIAVTGTVTDSNGLPLVGVNVVIKGTMVGTTTNKDGRFGIQAKSGNDIIVFSFIGYKSQEVKIGNLRKLNITLNEDAETLGEVIVMAYGEGVRQQNISGSVGKANLNDLLEAPVGSVGDALAGRLSGVMVTSGEGGPGANVDIVIRGNNSLTQDNSPLYVIDGFPMEGSVLSSINPNDIESMTILKDASSTAIYGARGANGVVLVNTKKGSIGRVQVTYQGDFGVDEVTKRMEMLSAYEFVKLQDQIYDPRSTFVKRYYPEGSGFSTIEDYRNVPLVDWQDRIFRTGFTQNHSVALNGGTQDTRYSVSFSYRDQEGIMQNSDYNRTQGRINLTQTISKKFRANVVANYTLENTIGSGANLRDALFYRPVPYPGEDLARRAYVLENDGITTRFNPVISQENEHRLRTKGSLSVNASLDYEIIKGLKLKIAGGVVRNNERQEAYNGPMTNSGNLMNSGNARGINASLRTIDYSSWLNENTLAYQTTLRKSHNISALVGITLQGINSDNNFAEVYQISNEQMGMGGMATGVPNQITSSISESALMSYLARFNYSYKSIYMFTASFRADGSSKFYGDNRWGYFPSGSFAWNPAAEKFWKAAGLDKVLSNTKVRASWGITGNNRVGDFAALATYSSGRGNEYPFGGSYIPGYVKNNLGNMDLKWETTTQTNIGLDLGFFKQRLNITTDIYRKVTSDLLLNADLSLSMGFDRVMKNIGKVRNQGLEITIESVNIKKRKFRWSTNFNISFNQSKVLALADNQISMLNGVGRAPTNYSTNIGCYISKIGQPMGQMYGHIYEGTYKYSDFDVIGGSYVLKKGIPSYDLTIEPGMPKYKDLNGDGVIDGYDQTIIGRGQPKAIGGFSNRFSYGNFALNIFFQWSLGNDKYNANKLDMLYPTNNPRERNMMAEYANRWSPENPNSDIPKSHMWGNFMTYYSTAVVEDGSYLRLKTASLTYNVPARIMKKISLSSASVTLSGNNLITWTNYTGLDPESSSFGQTLTPGYDFGAYPRSRTINLSIKLGF